MNRVRCGMGVALTTAAVLGTPPAAMACIATAFAAGSGGPTAAGQPVPYSFGSRGGEPSHYTLSVDGREVGSGTLEAGGTVEGSFPMPDLGGAKRQITVSVVTDDPSSDNRPLTSTVTYSPPAPTAAAAPDPEPSASATSTRAPAPEAIAVAATPARAPSPAVPAATPADASRRATKSSEPTTSTSRTGTSTARRGPARSGPVKVTTPTRTAGITAPDRSAAAASPASAATAPLSARKQRLQRVAEPEGARVAATRRTGSDNKPSTHRLGTVTRDVLQGGATITLVPPPAPPQPTRPPTPQVLPEQGPSVRRRLWTSLWPRRRKRGACLPRVGIPEPALETLSTNARHRKADMPTRS